MCLCLNILFVLFPFNEEQGGDVRSTIIVYYMYIYIYTYIHIYIYTYIHIIHIIHFFFGGGGGGGGGSRVRGTFLGLSLSRL